LEEFIGSEMIIERDGTGSIFDLLMVETIPSTMDPVPPHFGVMLLV